MRTAKATYGFKQIIVLDCPYCHKTHRHNHPVGDGQRMAECLQGEYILDFSDESNVTNKDSLHMEITEKPENN